jgi:hypothetical protein
VLYNPHFEPTLSSWPRWGRKVLEIFAADPDHNLIFAPHIRLFDGAKPADLQALEPFRDHPRIHIDLGGPRAVDMTYTRIADLYLGDVSSQVYEFLRTPRPTVFLNAHGVKWRGDESYGHFAFGPVLDRIEDLAGAVAQAGRDHGRFLATQRAGLAATFDIQPRSSSLRAAEAVAERVTSRMASPVAWRRDHPPVPA